MEPHREVHISMIGDMMHVNNTISARTSSTAITIFKLLFSIRSRLKPHVHERGELDDSNNRTASELESSALLKKN